MQIFRYILYGIMVYIIIYLAVSNAIDDLVRKHVIETVPSAVQSYLDSHDIIPIND